MNKAALKDMSTIVIRLTLTCLVAAFVMGLTFVLTHDAKEHNEQIREERVMYGILGYDSKKNPPPQTMALSTVYRYVITKADGQSIAYLLPDKSGKYLYVELDLAGNFVQKLDLPIDEVKVRNRGERDAAVSQVSGAEARYADNVIIVTNAGQRVAYILDGVYPGFKTTIRVKMALDAQFTMLGFEVLEHEEDPGLGGEIEQKWFRGQFEGKTADQLQETNVIRVAIPEDFKRALEGKSREDEDPAKIRAEHQADDIYALTGATISSRSVLEGNKAMVRKFVYRIQILDKVLSSQNISSQF